MTLNLDSLRNAVAALRAGQARAEDASFMTGLDAVTQDIIRSGVIQHFEFTYELAWKFMRRQLAADLGQSAIESINSRRDLFRVASENGLITDVDAWFRYHVARNQTSHTYDQQKAADVYTASLSFAADAAMLLAELEARNA